MAGPLIFLGVLLVALVVARQERRRLGIDYFTPEPSLSAIGRMTAAVAGLQEAFLVSSAEWEKMHDQFKEACQSIGTAFTDFAAHRPSIPVYLCEGVPEDRVFILGRADLAFRPDEVELDMVLTPEGEDFFRWMGRIDLDALSIDMRPGMPGTSLITTTATS